MCDLLAILFTQEADFVADRARQEAGLRVILESPWYGRIFLAKREGVVVGLASLLFTVSTAEGGLVCWFEDFVVEPSVRGGGIGSRLLEHATEYARANGYSRITLMTDFDNEGAQRLYARAGFGESRMKVMRLGVG